MLPGLALLGHTERILPAEGAALLDAPPNDALIVDGRRELAHARDLCRLIRTTGADVPVLLIVTEGGLAAVSSDWCMDDVLLDTAGPAEIEARLRVAIGRCAAVAEDDPEAHVIRSGEVTVDETTYTAKVAGRHNGSVLLEDALKTDLAGYRLLTREVLDASSWLKRFSQSLIKDDGKEAPNGA